MTDMKRDVRSFGMLTAGLGLMLASTFSACAEETGPYFNADVGVALTDDTELKGFPDAVPGQDIEFDPGVRMSLGGGYRFCNWFKAGAEFGVIANSVDGADIDVSQIPFMANFELSVPNKSPLVPFVGGGPGMSIGVITLDDEQLGGGSTVDGSASDAVFAWQVYAGLRYRINENMSAGIIYKYFEAEGPDWEVHGTTQDIRFGRSRTHSISGSFLMEF
jgi:opacity protein-like surface antigen